MDIPYLDRYLENIGRASTYYFVFASIAFVLFYIVLRKPMWFRKIQQKWPTRNDYKRDVLYSMLSILIISTITVLSFAATKDYNHLYYNIADYGLAYFAFTFVWMLLLHDTWFYFIHRAMHHPWLYKKVHLIHHKSTNPSPWTALTFHPLEAILEAGIFPIIAFTLPVHPTAIITFFLLHTVYNVYGHLGFELLPKGFHTHWLGRWVNTSTAHNLHHHKFTGNYGLYFLFWDRVFGTLRTDYDDTYEKVTNTPPVLDSVTS